MSINLQGYLFLFVLFLISNLAVAQNGFEKEIYVNDSDTLPYNILKPMGLKPEGNDKQNFPLVVFLHGAGERGNDNEKQIVHIKKLFLDPSNRANYKSFVIAPQCPEGQKWVDIDWTTNLGRTGDLSITMKKVLALIEEVIDTFPIDTNRIYVTGVSMGGYGAWELIAAMPDRIAAAIPICGGADITTADKIKNIPIWAFHGSADNVVPVKFSREIVQELKKYNGDILYTEYKGVKHGSWFKAYKEKDLLKWMFDKKRK